MITIILVVHLLIAVALIGIVLLQRSEGGGLGMGGGGGGGNFMSGRASANLLTRTTAILAGGFFVTSLALAMLTAGSHTQRSIMEQVPTTPTTTQPAAPAPAPAVPIGK